MKTILITGCSSGFGYMAAKYLAEKGHHVIASMRNVNGKNAGPAGELLEFGSKNKLKLEVLDLDVTSDESVKAAAEKLPGVDVLINNAGYGYGGAVEAFAPGSVLAQLDLNIVGTVRAAQMVLPGMRAKKSGLIIQVSSVAGRGAFPGWAVYNASKWGLEGLSEGMRYELAPLGIDVAIVEPGPFETKFLENMVPAGQEEIAEVYGHVNEFNMNFVSNVKSLFADENAPTDPMLIVKIFEDLIDAEPGSRPLRTIGGLDFGMQKINDVTEPVRKEILAGMGLSE
ncbi:SDR family oxidoreductase [uncultured Draconibacterium sp.]|uniref:SDR family oxidoreductase n=1 Tax=uncultured Draconibacterium sp. TaxID=1573823 RepID=UPI0025DA2303|nr:SDR family oxidoreductase [uncultured Draconibacterium sp.]